MMTLDYAGQAPVSTDDAERIAALTRKGWKVRPDPTPEQIAADAEAAQASAESARIAAIWQAAHDYEVAQVSGSAIGLLAMGVMAGKPKCIEVQAWIKSIWTLYYTRKATGSTDSDYSGCGQIPRSVPELMEELGL